MSGLFGNHIVGFPTRWLIFCRASGPFAIFQDSRPLDMHGGGKKKIFFFKFHHTHKYYGDESHYNSSILYNLFPFTKRFHTKFGFDWPRSLEEYHDHRYGYTVNYPVIL